MSPFRDDKEENRSNLRKKIDEIKNYKVEKLIREDLGKDFNFKIVQDCFERLIFSFGNLDVDVFDIPDKQINSLRSKIEEIIKLFKDITSFSPINSNNPKSEYQQILDNIVRIDQESFNLITPILSLTKKDESNFELIQKRFDKALSMFKNDFRSLMDNINNEYEEIKDVKNQVYSILESIKDVAKDIGVAKYGEIFKTQARKHDISSRLWLGITILLVVVTLGFAYYTFEKYDELWMDSYSDQILKTNLHDNVNSGSEKKAESNLRLISEKYFVMRLIQFSFFKLIVFSIFYFGIIWCSRNYKAHRHNSIINTHRNNALATFRLFIESSGEDKDVKNAVLLKTTETIFSPAVTGYISKEPDSQGSPQILEIVRGVLGKGSPD